MMNSVYKHVLFNDTGSLDSAHRLAQIAAIVAMSLTLSGSVASAACFPPTTPAEVAHRANEIIADSYVIFRGRLINAGDLKRNIAEKFQVIATLKGPSEKYWTFWSPKMDDELLTSESPQSGLHPGNVALIALSQRKYGLVIGECEAQVIYAPKVAKAVRVELSRR